MIRMIENSSLYHLHEMHHAALAPFKAMASAAIHMNRHGLNPVAYTRYGRTLAASAELFERVTRRYPKPEFGLTHTEINGKTIAVTEEVVDEKPFCRLLHFKRDTKQDAPRILVVAPMSGHHATLLRGTVEGLLPHADVWITDWTDGRLVPVSEGAFELDDYIDYVLHYLRLLGPDVHVMAVCQPSVPVMAAVALMNEDKDPLAPRSMTLIGGPIDTRVNPTKVNELAARKPLSWFESHVITRVPFHYPGFMRRVYPGFLQLTGFMSLDLNRHIGEHVKLFQHLVQGDGESATAHRKFYDEYLSVTDLPAEFYLQSIDKVFQRHLLPRGKFDYRGRIVKPQAITKTALLTLEGEMDNISGPGQTEAAQGLCSGLAASKKKHHLQPKVGHYGIFNGRRYRDHVVPVIIDFVEKQG